MIVQGHSGKSSENSRLPPDVTSGTSNHMIFVPFVSFVVRNRRQT
jgi:hypothetical protein